MRASTVTLLSTRRVSDPRETTRAVFQAGLKHVGETGRVSAVPQFPLVRRDIALVAEASVKNADIESVIRKNGGRELTKAEIFDIFKSKELKDGRRSLAYALEFRSPERTLTDDEVGRAFQRIVDALKATAGIEVRES